MQTAWGIYLHIPFCRSKCSYCAFVSQVASSPVQQDYIAALCREISAASGDFSVASVDTVFFGGGTPSVLSSQDLAKILTLVQKNYPLQPDAEITLEANPGTLSPEKLTELRQIGFNRLSIGVQSFDDRVLRTIGRTHSAADATKMLEQARVAGFDNVSADLMYGLPGQSEESWQNSLEQMGRLRPDHVSVYGLKLEEGTELAKRVMAEEICLPSDEAEERMYERVNACLPLQGLMRYEISNFALPGRECRHNLKYWNYECYRGFGVAAHSFDGSVRTANVEHVAEYLRRLQAGESAQGFREELSADTGPVDYIITGLRKVSGIDARHFDATFGGDFRKRYARQISELERGGWLRQEGWRIFLTAKGMKFANQVLTEFLP